METTPASLNAHMNPATDRVVEIAAARLDERGRLLSVASRRVLPDVPISATASAIHHIVDADVADCSDARAAISELGLRDAPLLVAHNGTTYDFAIVCREEPLLTTTPKLCTLRAARHMFPDAPSHKNQVLRYFLGLSVPYPWSRMASHGAAADAVVTSCLLERMLETRPMADLIDSQSRPVLLSVVGAGPKQWRGKPWEEVDVGLLRWFLARDFDEDVRHTARHWLSRKTGGAR